MVFENNVEKTSLAVITIPAKKETTGINRLTPVLLAVTSLFEVLINLGIFI